MRLAIITDIHANLPTPEAVAREVAESGRPPEFAEKLVRAA